MSKPPTLSKNSLVILKGRNRKQEMLLLVEELTKEIEAGELEEVVVVRKTKLGEILVNWTKHDPFYVLGLMVTAQTALFDEGDDWE